MKFWYNPNFLAIITLIILSIPALKSLSNAGFYTSHDGETHTARIAQYDLALKDGQFPPRIAKTLYNGLGSPIFVYIYPLPYILGSLIHTLGLTYADSFKLQMAVGFLLSSIFTYMWLKEALESEKAAFLGALFYAWVPYRFLLIYVRGSISELLAYTFLPLVFFTFTKLSKSKSIFWISLAAISTALVLLSQNLVAFISLPVLAGYIFIFAVSKKSFSALPRSIIAIVWAFLISSFVYLPTIFERQFVRLDEIIRTAYSSHFVTIGQLIHSPWGYGFDQAGTASDQMSFQIGLAHILIIVITAAIIILGAVRKLKIDKITLIFGTYFMSVFLISIFLMLDSKATSIFWQQFSPMKIIDIPWRFLGIAALASAALAGIIAKVLKPGLIFLLLITFVLLANRNHLRINESANKNDAFFENFIGSATQYDEFTTKWRQTTKSPEQKLTPAFVISGTANIKNIVEKSNIVSFDADVNSNDTKVRIARFYFPNTVALVDGKKTSFNITDPTTAIVTKNEDQSGLVDINLSQGAHTVAVKYTETPLRMFANIISAISIVTALTFLIIKYKKYGFS